MPQTHRHETVDRDGGFHEQGIVHENWSDTQVHQYLDTLMRLIEEGKVDPTIIISHRTSDLADGPNLYKTFRAKQDGCVRVVMFPHETGGTSGATAKRRAATASTQAV